MQMYDKVELYATIVVPENMLSLCCASDDIDTDVPLVPYRGDSLPESMHPYNLWEQNPKAVRSMVKAVKSATDNQIIIDSIPKNDDMEIIVDAYNEEHPDDSPIKMEDIVRLLGVANYAVSYPATDSKYAGSDLHEFTHIVYEGLTEYMKEVTPLLTLQKLIKLYNINYNFHKLYFLFHRIFFRSSFTRTIYLNLI